MRPVARLRHTGVLSVRHQADAAQHRDRAKRRDRRRPVCSGSFYVVVAGSLSPALGGVTLAGPAAWRTRRIRASAVSLALGSSRTGVKRRYCVGAVT